MITLEQRMESAEERERLIALLNSIPKYREVVRKCGYHYIAIQVMEGKTETFAYTSCNNSTGEITTVEKRIHTPDVTAYVQESTLTEILDRADTLMEHPLRAALHYAPRFKIRPLSAYWRILANLV